MHARVINEWPLVRAIIPAASALFGVCVSAYPQTNVCVFSDNYLNLFA